MLVQGATGLNSTDDLPVPSNSTLTGRSFFSNIASSISSILQGSQLFHRIPLGHTEPVSVDLSFNLDRNNTQTISVNQPFNLVDANAQCALDGNTTAFTAGLKVDVVAAATASVNYGIVAEGTIVPPVGAFDRKLFERLTAPTTESHPVWSLR